MATKWKNISEKVLRWIKKDVVRKCVGVTTTILGIALFLIMIQYQEWYTTKTILKLCFFGNVHIVISLLLLLQPYLRWKYRNWNIEKDADYAEWKKISKKSKKTLFKVGIVEGIIAIAYMWAIMYYYNIYWYHNYAAGYAVLLTVLIQFIVSELLLKKFWNKHLDEIMGQMEIVNQKRIAEALEIEKKSMEKVSRSDQLRVDLITNVSHDLKTPLTSMVGYIELIKKEELSDVVKDYVDVISARAEKLGEMINSLFNLAKASSGNVELHKEKFEVNRLLEQIFADMSEQIKESELKFVKQYTEESTEIVSDNAYFYRICQNLIENALKYSAKGTRVFVKTYFQKNGESNRLCVDITNTSAYPMDFEKEDIVERFARGDKARSSEGNGLGLAIVSTYAKALGGEFDIKIDCDQFKACLICGEKEKQEVVEQEKEENRK
nr:HAMP domain-containing sensor histidine kinase [uncultured Mediterraneibacter sp.]